MTTNILTKFDQNRTKIFDLESANPNFEQFKGHYLGVHMEIWLVIELGLDIMPINIFTKFD